LDWDTINEQIKDLPAEKAKRYQAFPFIHEMGAVLAAADLIVSRSGASTLGEYPLFGLPAILVPYPYAWRYQKVNASYLVDRGAAVMVKDESLNERLLGQIRSLIFDQDKLNRMSQAMADLATPEAAAKIAEMLYEMTKSQD
jgi:UDP-N-acetylglucosamine--N-acetylmuramyl-(pentapeptide) pyrophosphoryl-undecaprenol N-acetylglucosamine transferase